MDLTKLVSYHLELYLFLYRFCKILDTQVLCRAIGLFTMTKEPMRGLSVRSLNARHPMISHAYM